MTSGRAHDQRHAVDRQEGDGWVEVGEIRSTQGIAAWVAVLKLGRDSGVYRVRSPGHGPSFFTVGPGGLPKPVAHGPHGVP